jgi:predicted DCC family thiol-disulfide oxidoreductase YuxK
MSQTVHNQTGETVIYDGDCAFCRRWIEKMRDSDGQQRLEFIPRQSPESEQRFPQIKDIDLDEGILFVEPGGKVHVAADAMYEIGKRLPGWRFITWLYRIPGIKQATKVAYSTVAANRKHLGCNSDYCKLHK